MRRAASVGAPNSLYEEPAAAFVANFIGEQNRIAGRVHSLSHGLARIDSALGPLVGRAGPGLRIGEAAELMVRPERVVIALATERDNRLIARLTNRALEGATEICGFAAAGQTLSVLRLTARTALQEGDYSLTFDARDAVVFPLDAPAA